MIKEFNNRIQRLSSEIEALKKAKLKGSGTIKLSKETGSFTIPLELSGGAAVGAKIAKIKITCNESANLATLEFAESPGGRDYRIIKRGEVSDTWGCIFIVKIISGTAADVAALGNGIPVEVTMPFQVSSFQTITSLTVEVE